MPLEHQVAVVIGGSNIDFKARSAVKATPQTSNPGHSSMTPGGVGRNVAENIARLGDRVHLISVVGEDSMGDDLIRHTEAAGVSVDQVARTSQSTGTYTAVLDVDGELIVAISDMAAVAELDTARLDTARDLIASASVVVLDGNLSLGTFNHAVELASPTRIVFEPVSVPKAAGLRNAIDDRIFAITPNRDELAALTAMPAQTDHEIATAANALHDRGVRLVWVGLGERGSMLSSSTGIVEIPAFPTDVVEVTGAGDSMLGAFCHGLLAGASPTEAARLGHAAAALTIASQHTVRPDLSPALLRATLDNRPT